MTDNSNGGETTVVARLSAVVDPSVKRATDQFKAELKSVNQQLVVSLEEYAAILQKTGGDEKAMVAELNKLEQSRGLKTVADDADKVADKLDKVKAKTKETASGLDEISKNGLDTNVTDVLPTSGEIRQSALGRLGVLSRFAGQAGIEGAGQLSGGLELAGAAQDIAGVTLSVGALAAGAGVLGVALGGASLLLNQQKEAEEKLAEATQATIDKLQLEADVRNQVAGVIATGSASTAQAKLTEAETQRDQLLAGQYKDTIDQMQAYVDEKLRPVAENEARSDLREAGIRPEDDIFASELKRRTNENIESLTQGDPVLKDFSDKLGSVDSTDPNTLNGQLNGLNEVIKQLTETGLPGAQALEAINQPLKDQQALRELEAKSLKDLVEQRNTDVADLVATNQRITDTEAGISKARADGNVILADTLTNQNVKNRADADALERELNLIAISQSLVQAREDEVSRINMITSASQTANEFVTKYFADTKKANDDIAQLDLDHGAKIEQLSQAASDKEIQLKKDEADKEASITADANDKAADLGAKYGIDRQRAEEDLQDKLKELRKQAALDEGQAEQQRDAVAFDRIESQEKLTEQKEKSDADKTERRRNQDYQRELTQLATATQKRIDAERTGLQKSLDQAAEATQAKLTLENQQYTAEITKRQQALDVMKAQYDQFIAQISGAGNAYRPPNALDPNTINYIYDPNYGQTLLKANLPSHELGLNRVPYDGYVASLHKDELIATAQEASAIRQFRAGLGGNMPFMLGSDQTSRYMRGDSGGSRVTNFNVNGATTKTIYNANKRMIRQAFDEFIDDMPIDD